MDYSLLIGFIPLRKDRRLIKSQSNRSMLQNNNNNNNNNVKNNDNDNNNSNNKKRVNNNDQKPKSTTSITSINDIESQRKQLSMSAPVCYFIVLYFKL
jgi:hypothetical protein